MGGRPDLTVRLLFDGRHVWSNEDGRVRVGGDFTASVSGQYCLLECSVRA